MACGCLGVPHGVSSGNNGVAAMCARRYHGGNLAIALVEPGGIALLFGFTLGLGWREQAVEMPQRD